MITGQALRFVLVGAGAAAVNIVSRIILNRVMSYALAVPLAYLVGMAVAFLLNRRFVFPACPLAVRVQVWRFVLVNLAGLAQVWGLSLLLDRLVLPALGLADQAATLAHLIAVATPIITSYLGHKYFSFAGAADEGRLDRPI